MDRKRFRAVLLVIGSIVTLFGVLVIALVHLYLKLANAQMPELDRTTSPTPIVSNTCRTAYEYYRDPHETGAQVALGSDRALYVGFASTGRLDRIDERCRRTSVTLAGVSGFAVLEPAGRDSLIALVRRAGRLQTVRIHLKSYAVTDEPVPDTLGPLTAFALAPNVRPGSRTMTSWYIDTYGTVIDVLPSGRTVFHRLDFYYTPAMTFGNDALIMVDRKTKEVVELNASGGTTRYRLPTTLGIPTDVAATSDDASLVVIAPPRLRFGPCKYAMTIIARKTSEASTPFCVSDDQIVRVARIAASGTIWLATSSGSGYNDRFDRLELSRRRLTTYGISAFLVSALDLGPQTESSKSYYLAQAGPTELTLPQ